MKRTQIELPEFFDRYINLCDDVTVIEALEICIVEIENAPIEKWEALGLRTYAPSKWTINEMLQHIIDTERIFNFRALSFARNEQQKMPSFDEDEYVKQSAANNRTLSSIIEELLHVHQATLALYKSFDSNMLSKEGLNFKGKYSVHAMGFIIAGHQRWHLKVLEERYYPII